VTGSAGRTHARLVSEQWLWWWWWCGGGGVSGGDAVHWCCGGLGLGVGVGVGVGVREDVFPSSTVSHVVC
jgi:hypothetical protein